MCKLFFLTLDDDETETKQNKTSIKDFKMSKNCSSHLGKRQVNSPILTEIEPLIYYDLKRQLSDLVWWFWYDSNKTESWS